MISREFVDWACARPIRLIAMILMTMTLTFLLVVSVGLHFHQAQLTEQQIQELKRIDDNAQKALAESARVRTESARNRQEIKQIEKTIGEDR